MSGYTASARLQGGSLRFMAAESNRPAGRDRGATAPGAWLDREPVELVGQPLGARVAERWDDLRETWSQLTFFLFDPESWR